MMIAVSFLLTINFENHFVILDFALLECVNLEVYCLRWSFGPWLKENIRRAINAAWYCNSWHSRWFGKEVSWFWILQTSWRWMWVNHAHAKCDSYMSTNISLHLTLNACTRAQAFMHVCVYICMYNVCWKHKKINEPKCGRRLLF